MMHRRNAQKFDADCFLLTCDSNALVAEVIPRKRRGYQLTRSQQRLTVKGGEQGKSNEKQDVVDVF